MIPRGYAIDKGENSDKFSKLFLGGRDLCWTAISDDDGVSIGGGLEGRSKREEDRLRMRDMIVFRSTSQMMLAGDDNEAEFGHTPHQ